MRRSRKECRHGVLREVTQTLLHATETFLCVYTTVEMNDRQVWSKNKTHSLANYRLNVATVVLNAKLRRLILRYRYVAGRIALHIGKCRRA